MRRLFAFSLAITLACGVALACGAALAAEPYKAPRNRVGQPDLQGLWTNSSLTFLQRPLIFKNLAATEAEEKMMQAGFKQMAAGLLDTHVDPNKPAPPVVPQSQVPQADIIEMDLNLARLNGQKRTSWIVEPADGRLPFTDAGKKAAAAFGSSRGYDGPEARPHEERCLISIGSAEGPPMMNTGFNAHYQIVQTRDHVAIHTEMNHDVRIIRLADRTHAPSAIRPYMGDSVGWWEGDILVVETTNMIPGVGVGSLGGGFAWSAGGKLIERFTRTARDEILYEFTIDDPAHFTKVWRGEMPMRTARGPIYEYACHEGNYSIGNALRGARVQEAEAKANPPPAAPPKPASAAPAAN